MSRAKPRFRGRLRRPVWNVIGRIRCSRDVGRRPLTDLTRYERRIHSQNGEDGILEAIFAAVGTTNRYLVEFGVGSGWECNAAYWLRYKGWSGLLMDVGGGRRPYGAEVRSELVTAENVEQLFSRYEVPPEPDLLSIDIDGNDYWVWKSIVSYRPRVVVIEYNASLPVTESLTIRYDPAFRWTGTSYFGASLLALARLGQRKGYALVGCESSGTNAFFVADELVAGRFDPPPIERIFRPPAYGGGRGHPPDPRPLVSVE